MLDHGSSRPRCAALAIEVRRSSNCKERWTFGSPTCQFDKLECVCVCVCMCACGGANRFLTSRHGKKTWIGMSVVSEQMRAHLLLFCNRKNSAIYICWDQSLQTEKMVVKVVGQLVVMPDERSITSGSFRRAAKFRRFEKLMVELIPQQSHITQDPQGLNTLTCSSKTLRPSAAGKKTDVYFSMADDRNPSHKSSSRSTKIVNWKFCVHSCKNTVGLNLRTTATISTKAMVCSPKKPRIFPTLLLTDEQNLIQITNMFWTVCLDCEGPRCRNKWVNVTYSKKFSLTRNCLSQKSIQSLHVLPAISKLMTSSSRFLPLKRSFKETWVYINGSEKVML